MNKKDKIISFGEVFTTEQEVNAMLDLVTDQCNRIDSRFLEPACGTGNFLIEVLHRKLALVSGFYSKSQVEFERYTLLAVASMYGVDIQLDNVIACRERLRDFAWQTYLTTFKQSAKNDFNGSIETVLNSNIVWGDALSLKKVDGSDQPIVFPEWSLVTGNKIKRRDFSFHHLLAYQPSDSPDLFSDLGEEAFIPDPVREFPVMSYMEIKNYDFS